MKQYALFLGCNIPSRVPQYESAARKSLEALDFDLVDLPFNCCGYPMRDQYFEAYLLAAAKNMALAEAKGLNMLALCKCCLGSLKRAQSFLNTHDELRAMVNKELAEEDLTYKGTTQIQHLQSVLYHEVGLEELDERVRKHLEGVKVAAFYGCHALRPSRVTGFDNPYDPHIIDDLIKTVGGTSVPWEGRLKCCGAPQREKNPELSLATVQERLEQCAASGADVLNVDCPHTLLQVKWAFENWREAGKKLRGLVVYPQLLGLALGLDPESLGLDENTPSASFLAKYLVPKKEKPAKKKKKAEAAA